LFYTFSDSFATAGFMQLNGSYWIINIPLTQHKLSKGSWRPTKARKDEIFQKIDSYLKVQSHG
jgi:hypothetical protein